MPFGVPILYDLRVVLSGPDDGVYHVSYELLQRGDYPPTPAPTGAPAAFDLPAQVLGRHAADIPAQVVERAQLPRDLADLGRLDELDLLRHVNARWPRETLDTRLRELADQLFAGPARAMLGTLLATATPPELAPDDSLGIGAPDLWNVGRITLELGSPALALVPWELLTASEPLWRRCIILRRQSAPAGQRTGPFDLPISVLLSAENGALPPGPVGPWADGLFDGFTHQSRDLGGIQWGDEESQVRAGEIHHAVFSSASAWSFFSTLTDVRGLGEWPLGVWSTPPRLLVLHDVSGEVPAYLLARAVDHALERGADAVLLVGFGVADPAAGGFFPTFYRKLMHNWPLDRCLLAALQAAERNGLLPTGWVFGAREGGELRLLLTRAVVEAAERLAARAAPPPPVESLGPAGPALEPLGPQPVPRPRFRGVGAPPPAPPPPPIAAAPAARAERAAADLADQAQRALDSRREAAIREAQEAAATFVPLGAEAHDVAVLAGHRERVREAERADAQGHGALEALGQATPSVVHASTVRLTNVWLTDEGDGSAGQVVGRDDGLTVERPYALHLQIGPRRVEAIAAEAFPDAALEELLRQHDRLGLDVMLFSPATDFAIDRPRLPLWLPRYGATDEIAARVRPRRAGRCRLRVCIYYRNTLLQSILVEATVVAAGARPAPAAGAPGQALVARTIDYLASTDLSLLDELPRPVLNVFTNEDDQGTHWIGVFSSNDTTGFGFESGQLVALDSDTLATLAEASRAVLAKAQGVTAYALPVEPPLDEQHHLKLDADAVQRCEASLCELAVTGWTLYDTLLSQAGVEVARRKALAAQLRSPGIISIARCRGESATIPWAALYGIPLDTGSSKPTRLCGIFKEQLQANNWSDGAGQLLAKEKRGDLLDDPRACRANPHCPLNGPDARVTVCPFGFWGFLHQIEQPLQQVKPTDLEQTPGEAKKATFNQTSLLVRQPGGKVRLAIGAYSHPDFGTEDHIAEIEALDERAVLDVTPRIDRDQVLALLEQGGQHLYYFYCHGELVGPVFKLKLGEYTHPGYIAAADLPVEAIDWPDPPQPLVILNGCETVALLPERIHVLLERLRELGSCGVVGTEIKVKTGLARPVGRLLLQQILAGRSVGEACLEIRRHLLRQYNPLGLVYSLYAPATLHLHAGDGTCGWCERHQGAPAATPVAAGPEPARSVAGV